MSKLSIYQTSWLNLVFEDRNKEYGAYQLRQETVKTSFSALFIGLLFVSTLAIIPLIVNRFSPVVPIPDLPEIPHIIPFHVTPTVIPQVQKPVVEVKQTNTAKATTSLANLTIVAPSEATPVDFTKNDNSSNVKPTGEQPGIPGTEPKGPVVNTVAPVIPNSGPVGPATIYELDKKPEFPGGINKFYAFVGNNFEKPELESGQIMKIYVSFVIEKDGSMSDIKVLQDPGFGLGKEAIRVLKSLKTKWTPGIIDNQAVRTAYSLPISVQMD